MWDGRTHVACSSKCASWMPHERSFLFRFCPSWAQLLRGVTNGLWDPVGFLGPAVRLPFVSLFFGTNEGSLDVLFRDSKLTMLLSESLGNINCRTTMIAHVSDSPVNYTETLTTVQLASRIHRTRKKKSKVLLVLFISNFPRLIVKNETKINWVIAETSVLSLIYGSFTK